MGHATYRIFAAIYLKVQHRVPTQSLEKKICNKSNVNSSVSYNHTLKIVIEILK